MKITLELRPTDKPKFNKVHVGVTLSAEDAWKIAKDPVAFQSLMEDIKEYIVDTCEYAVEAHDKKEIDNLTFANTWRMEKKRKKKTDEDQEPEHPENKGLDITALPPNLLKDVQEAIGDNDQSGSTE